MRVICIAGVKKGRTGTDLSSGETTLAGKEHEIFEGETYTVVLVETHSGKDYYSLAERSIETGYAASRFIPLSTIDEMELLEQRQTELV